jgi:hypothetical protein
MTNASYIQARSAEIGWQRAGGDSALGEAFEGVWHRRLIDADPGVWEIRLEPERELPPHAFDSQTVQWFTSGSVTIAGERPCGNEDVRWGPPGAASGKWKAGSMGARFYLIAIGGEPSATIHWDPGSAPGGETGVWAQARLSEIAWVANAADEHVAPPGLRRDVCASDPYMALVACDPHCVIERHAHPGDILYIMLEGEMDLPGEGRYEVGDVRWGAKDYEYGPETMGPTGSLFVALQKDQPLGVDWRGGKLD